MKRNALTALFFFMVWMGHSETAQAACGLSLTASDISVSWNLNFTSFAVSVNVNRSTTDACVYSLGFSKGGAASYTDRRGITGAQVIRYQLYKDSGLSKTLKDGADVVSTDEVVQGGFQAGATPVSQTINYYFDIPYNLATTPSLVSAGSYTDSFVINVYESDTPPFITPVATKTITVNIGVLRMIALSLVNAGAAFTEGQVTRNMNFMTMSQGNASSFDMRVRSNAGFSVSFSSANNGKLKHTDPMKSGSLVPYSLYVNAVLLNMSTSNATPVVGLTGNGSTAMSGLAYPIKVVIGNLSGSNVLAGPHSDDVTITATTTE